MLPWQEELAELARPFIEAERDSEDRPRRQELENHLRSNGINKVSSMRAEHILGFTKLIQRWKHDDEKLSAPTQTADTLKTTRPVRETVVKQLVPGTYGKIVVVGEEAPAIHAIAIDVLFTKGTATWFNAEDLRAAATTFTELADYLDSKLDL